MSCSDTGMGWTGRGSGTTGTVPAPLVARSMQLGFRVLQSCLIGSWAPCARRPVHLNEGFSKSSFFSLGLRRGGV